MIRITEEYIYSTKLQRMVLARKAYFLGLLIYQMEKSI
jgi:hypothetical protein